MKSDNVAVRLALLSFGVLLLIIPSSSNALRIELSMSPYGQDCQMGNDAGPGLRTVYVLHGGSGMLGVRFKVSLRGILGELFAFAYRPSPRYRYRRADRLLR